MNVLEQIYFIANLWLIYLKPVQRVIKQVKSSYSTLKEWLYRRCVFAYILRKGCYCNLRCFCIVPSLHHIAIDIRKTHLQNRMNINDLLDCSCKFVCIYVVYFQCIRNIVLKTFFMPFPVYVNAFLILSKRVILLLRMCLAVLADIFCWRFHKFRKIPHRWMRHQLRHSDCCPESLLQLHSHTHRRYGSHAERNKIACHTEVLYLQSFRYGFVHLLLLRCFRQYNLCIGYFRLG